MRAEEPSPTVSNCNVAMQYVDSIVTLVSVDFMVRVVGSHSAPFRSRSRFWSLDQAFYCCCERSVSARRVATCIVLRSCVSTVLLCFWSEVLVIVKPTAGQVLSVHFWHELKGQFTFRHRKVLKFSQLLPCRSDCRSKAWSLPTSTFSRRREPLEPRCGLFASCGL